LLAARLTRPIADTGDIYLTAIAMRGHADPKDLPLARVIAADVMPQRAGRLFTGGRETTLAADLAELRTLDEVAAAVNVIAFALVGLALAGARGWTLVARALCLAAMWVILDRSLPILHMLVWPYGTPQPTRAVASLPALFVIPLAACISFAVRPRFASSAAVNRC
jgi:hypothetical protein